jgi:hemerythrin-like domain-containing protein
LKRDPALQPLSRDHHQALVEALRLREAAAAVPTTRLDAARAFLAFASTELAGHFADEEQVLPGPARRADPEGWDRLEQEHAGLRALVEGLRAACAAGEVSPALLADTGELLRDHVRFEERALFERLQERLTAGELQALGEALLAARWARGQAEACSLR